MPDPNNDRIPCAVLGCRRTAPRHRYPDCDEIICGKCWRTIPRQLRRRYRRVEKIVERAPDKSILKSRAIVFSWKLWEKVKAAAIEARAGIG